jgi:hypothetical protein
MSIQLQMEQMPGYLAASFIGSGAPPDVWRQFELIAENCKRTKNDKLLIDVLRVDGKISLIERFMMGERTQLFLYYGIKVVFVEKPERIDPGKFAMLVAQNRGVNVDAFTDFQASKEWLMK